jgi:hypothetical protein
VLIGHCPLVIGAELNSGARRDWFPRTTGQLMIYGVMRLGTGHQPALDAPRSNLLRDLMV